MSKKYTIVSTSCMGGALSYWSSRYWTNFYQNATLLLVGSTSSKAPRAVYYMFNETALASLRTKTVQSVKLTITVANGVIPSSTGYFPTFYQIGYKYNNKTGSSSSSDAWARGNSDSSSLSTESVGYINHVGGDQTADNTQVVISLGTNVPRYGYVIGPETVYNSRRLLELGSTATLEVTTNENDYSYSLEYNANGGSGSPENQTGSNTGISPSYTFVVSNTIPSRTGYTFLGWSISSSATTASYVGGDSITVTSAGTTTLYAVWEIVTYTVGYNANGGSGAPSAQTKTYGQELTLSSITPTRSNAFAGSYTVTYNANGGSVSPASASASRITSYSFKNWNTASGGGGNSYNPGGSYTDNAAATMYAQWNQSTTTASVTLPTPTRAGYNFIGWYTAASGGTKVGDAGGAYEPTASSTIYAQWVASVVAPTFTVQPVSKSVYIGETAILSVSATTSQGTISYQWQISYDNSIFSTLSGETSASYSAPTSNVGTVYYRCVATATLDGISKSSISDTATVSVLEVNTPVFTSNPKSATYAIGAQALPMTVNATSGGVLSYQWQLSSDNSNWSDISGETSTSYRPSTTVAGITHYRCVATATGGAQVKTANSNSATITVIQASTPVFVYDLSSVDVTYNAGDASTSLNGTATASNGTITYQWYKSTDSGTTWFPIPGAQSPTFQPSTNIGGTAYYRVTANNIVGTSSVSSTSGSAKVTVLNVILSYDEKWSQYINSVGKPFVKLARLDFLNPNGSVLFTLDNNPNNDKSGAFIQSGELSVNLQNGARRVATVTLSNIDGDFNYNVNKLWFGQQVRLWEGMILPSGQDFYISQGVFYVKDPDEVFEPGLKQTTLNLVDKWAYLDGTLFGNLEGTYEVPLNSNIFNVVQSVLNLDRGNGQKIDSSVPIFTSYYNGKTTTLPDGSVVPLTNTPYTYRCDSENGTYADIILEMNTMLAGWIGYDANGQLRLDPSQDDIIDTTKPVQWQFSTTNSTFLGATYSVKNSEVYNDIIIVGESLSEYGQTAGRATNYDPKSDTNANIIGLKTKRYQQAGYYTQDICESLAVFKLKRESVLKKSVSIKCSQLFHLQENNLVTIERTDKLGNPIERHLITGYTRPIAQNGEMVCNCTAVNDFPVATITTTA